MTRWNTGRTGVEKIHFAGKKPNQRTYTWRGETFISQSDVAAEAGVTVRAVRLQLQRHGHLANLGNGGNTDTTAATAAISHPITVLGFEFPSLRAFAAKVGKSRTVVHRWAQAGRTDKMEAALIEAARAEASA